MKNVVRTLCNFKLWNAKDGQSVVELALFAGAVAAVVAMCTIFSQVNSAIGLTGTQAS